MKTQNLQTTLISGLIGAMLGAGSMYVVDASIIKLHRVTPIERPSLREIQADGIWNRESNTGTRPSPVRGTGY